MTSVKRPRLLSFAGVILMAQSATLALIVLIGLIVGSSVKLTWSGRMPQIGAMSLAEMVVLMLLSVVLGFLGKGLWRGRPLARHAAYALFALPGLIAIIVRRDVLAIPVWLILVSLAGWYLYCKPNVQRYFS
ncbi:MAG: hypothetical protein AAGJ86_07495 [Pseudomonadota bacterium]